MHGTAKETNNAMFSRLITKLCLDNFSVQNKTVPYSIFITYLTVLSLEASWKFEQL